MQHNSLPCLHGSMPVWLGLGALHLGLGLALKLLLLPVLELVAPEIAERFCDLNRDRKQGGSSAMG